MIKAGNTVYRGREDLPEEIPVFPLTGALLLPGGQMPLNIFEPRYVKMIDDAVSNNKLIGIIQPCLKPENSGVEPPPLCKIGCIGRITAYQESGDGRYLISLSGVCRFKVVEEIDNDLSYRSCRIEVMQEDLGEVGNACEQIDREHLLAAFRKYLEANGLDADWSTVKKTSTDTLVTALCMMSPYGPAEKQALLEAPDVRSRAETLIMISEMHIAHQSGDEGGTLQ